MQTVNPSDLRIVEMTKYRKNVIQVSTQEVLLMWDLDANEQVTYLSGYDQFTTVDTFVRTGLQMYIKSKDLGKNNW